MNEQEIPSPENMRRRAEMALLSSEIRVRAEGGFTSGILQRAAELLVLAFEDAREQPASTAIKPMEATRLRRMGPGPVQVMLVSVADEGSGPESLASVLPSVWPPRGEA